MRFLLLLILIFLVVKCGTTTSIMTENYKDRLLQGKQVMVMPLTEDAVNVHNKDDVKDDFENDDRNPEDIIKGWVEQYLTDICTSNLQFTKVLKIDKDSLTFPTCRDTANFKRIVKKITSDSIRYDFFIPKKEMLKNKGITPDIGIIVNRIDFGRNFAQGIGYFSPGQTVSTPGGSFNTGGMWMGGGGSEFLGADFLFIVYDYENDQVISYGEETIKNSFLFGMKRSTWESTFKAVAYRILKYVPIAKIRYIR